MIIAETKRLILRTLKLEDIGTIVSIWGDEEVMKYSGGAGSRERELGALRYYLKLQEEKGYSPYAVIMKETREIVGVCGFNPPDDEHIELMYHFAKKYWGNGLASESSSACIEYARNSLKAEKLAAYTEPENIASKNVLLKSGFVYMGNKHHSGSGKVEHYFEMQL